VLYRASRFWSRSSAVKRSGRAVIERLFDGKLRLLPSHQTRALQLYSGINWYSVNPSAFAADHIRVRLFQNRLSEARALKQHFSSCRSAKMNGYLPSPKIALTASVGAVPIPCPYNRDAPPIPQDNHNLHGFLSHCTMNGEATIEPKSHQPNEFLVVNCQPAPGSSLA
jgi:hypothetical protein